MASAAESKSKLKYRAIMKSMTGLVDFIDGGDPVKLALRLLQEGLLNENTYEELLMESKTGTDKARKIVNELLKKVKVNPEERYEKLIEVLNEEEMFDAVKLIKERYKEVKRKESFHRRKSSLEYNYTKRKDSRKRSHSESLRKSIKKHKMMGEDASDIIQEEDDSSSDSQGQQIESGSLSSTLDVETDYPSCASASCKSELSIVYQIEDDSNSAIRKSSIEHAQMNYDEIFTEGSRCRRISYSGSEQSERKLTSGRKRHSEHSEDISSSKRPRIESQSLDSVSDTEIDIPKNCASASRKSELNHTEDSNSAVRKSYAQTNCDEHLPESAERRIKLKTALSVISNVSKYVNLGIQLEVSSTKIEEFNQYSPEEQKIKIIQAWFDHDPNPTYKTLHQALLMPSVDDKRAARQLLLGLSSSMNSSISADGVHNESSSVDTKRDGPDLPFNEASVLNAIAKISDNYTLGTHLGLDGPTMSEIKKYPVNEQKQKLVARWFADEEPKNCNWAKLNAAIDEMKVLEWNDRYSFTSTASLDSNASPITTTSQTQYTDEGAELESSDSITGKKNFIYQNNFMVLKCEEHNFSMTFQSESLPTGTYSSIVNISVVSGEDCVLPKETQPVSMFFSINCQHTFQKNVLVSIEHFSAETSDLSFVVSSDPQPPFQFELLSGGEFDTKRCGKIERSEFSILAIVTRIRTGRWPRMFYYCALYTSPPEDYTWTVYIYITKDSATYKHRIEKKINDSGIKFNTSTVANVNHTIDYFTLDVSLNDEEKLCGWQLPPNTDSIKIERTRIDRHCSLPTPAIFKIILDASKNRNLCKFVHGYKIADVVQENILSLVLSPQVLPARQQESEEPVNESLSTIDLEVLQCQRSKLVTGLKSDMDWLASELVYLGILSTQHQNDIANIKSTLNPHERANIMVSAIMDKIELDFNNLKKIIKVLKKKPNLYRETIALLEGNNICETIMCDRISWYREKNITIKSVSNGDVVS